MSPSIKILSNFFDATSFGLHVEVMRVELQLLKKKNGTKTKYPIGLMTCFFMTVN